MVAMPRFAAIATGRSEANANGCPVKDAGGLKEMVYDLKDMEELSAARRRQDGRYSEEDSSVVDSQA
eukprot:6181045-Pleurochrysis_carterae.AAC.2